MRLQTLAAIPVAPVNQVLLVVVKLSMQFEFSAVALKN